ncbi:Uncharacterized protein Fot_50366 [Forsythia ovata]|uniref:Uncharacterized protein n=1 Tax=Forsythia ovata TaxID=205694 RepID=A0ABD1PY26_9LAMI
MSEILKQFVLSAGFGAQLKKEESQKSCFIGKCIPNVGNRQAHEKKTQKELEKAKEGRENKGRNGEARWCKTEGSTHMMKEQQWQAVKYQSGRNLCKRSFREQRGGNQKKSVAGRKNQQLFLELMDLAASSQGLPSIVSFDYDTMQNFKSFCVNSRL